MPFVISYLQGIIRSILHHRGEAIWRPSTVRRDLVPKARQQAEGVLAMDAAQLVGAEMAAGQALHMLERGAMARAITAFEDAAAESTTRCVRMACAPA